MNESIPMLGDVHNLSVFKLKAWLVTQDEPYKTYQNLRKKVTISKGLDRAIRLEMRRIGVNNFPLQNEE